MRLQLVLLAAAIVAGIVWRAHRGRQRRALTNTQRLSLLVLAPRDLDPTDEEVDRYAAQLARTRRVVRRRPQRANAVRLRLDAQPQGRVAYRLQGPRSVQSILTVPGYDGVELREEPAPDHALQRHGEEHP